MISSCSLRASRFRIWSYAAELCPFSARARRCAAVCAWQSTCGGGCCPCAFSAGFELGKATSALAEASSALDTGAGALSGAVSVERAEAASALAVALVPGDGMGLTGRAFSAAGSLSGELSGVMVPSVLVTFGTALEAQTMSGCAQLADTQNESGGNVGKLVGVPREGVMEVEKRKTEKK